MLVLFAPSPVQSSSIIASVLKRARRESTQPQSGEMGLSSVLSYADSSSWVVLSGSHSDSGRNMKKKKKRTCNGIRWSQSSTSRTTNRLSLVMSLSNNDEDDSAVDFSTDRRGGRKRSSPSEVKKELQKCYEHVHKLGRGVIYLGSSRVNIGHPHYLQAMELGREIANLLDCTTWTGAGPGLMDAAIKGALEAGKPVGGFKIARESGEWTASNFHPYLPAETYLTCRFFSARKHALVDATVRSTPLDMTAVVALPGGIGTLDEVFEILALIQLERIGSKLPVPFLLMNYDSFYSKLLEFMDDCEKWGTVAKGELASLWKVCDENLDALEYLAEFYDIPESKLNFMRAE